LNRDHLLFAELKIFGDEFPVDGLSGDVELLNDEEEKLIVLEDFLGVHLEIYLWKYEMVGFVFGVLW